MQQSIKIYYSIDIWYSVASCWICLYELYYDAQIHERQDSNSLTRHSPSPELTKQQEVLLVTFTDSLCLSLIYIEHNLSNLIKFNTANFS